MASQTKLPAIKALLFDMDGLLIDTEDLYTMCANEALREFHKPDLPWNIKAQLQGRPGPEAERIFHQWANLPITPTEFRERQMALQRKYFPRTQPLPGVADLLKTLSTGTDPPVEIALATSSHSGNFQLKTAHLKDLFAAFAPEHRLLGDDARIPQGRGKPAPDIYLLALETINSKLRAKGDREIKPEECLVLEDSVLGVEAGRRAGMQVVWCPHPGLLQEYRGQEQEVLAGLTSTYVESEEELAQSDREAGAGNARGKGAPGTIGDGWARLFTTLEDFPYADYGIQANSN